MAVFPKIQSPCPYKSRLASVMEGDMCRMCNRQVFDLSFMADEERIAFLQGCADEVCVSYRLPLRPALAAAALAASAVALPTTAAAQDQVPVIADASVESVAAEATSPEEMWIVVGGIKDPSKVEYVEDLADADIPELPIVYEEDFAGRSPAAAAPRGDAAAGTAPRPVS